MSVAIVPTIAATMDQRELFVSDGRIVLRTIDIATGDVVDRAVEVVDAPPRGRGPIVMRAAQAEERRPIKPGLVLRDQ